VVPAERASAASARTILGVNGISGEYPVMRHADDLESVLTYAGTVEMHTLTIGQAWTGHSAFPADSALKPAHAPRAHMFGPSGVRIAVHPRHLTTI
jgi:hypothetical protein